MGITFPYWSRFRRLLCLALMAVIPACHVDTNEGGTMNSILIAQWPNWFGHFAFTPDGRQLLIAGDRSPPGGVVAYDIVSGKWLGPITDDPRTIWGDNLALSRDGQFGVFDGDAGIFRVWDMAKRREAARIDCRGGKGRSGQAGLATVLTPDGKTFFATLRGMGRQTIYQCRVADGTVTQHYTLKGSALFTQSEQEKGTIDRLTLSPDGKTLAFTEWQRVVTLDAATGKEQGKFQSQETSRFIAFSPDSQFVLFNADCKVIRCRLTKDGPILDKASEEFIHPVIPNTFHLPTCGSLSHDGKVLALGLGEGNCDPGYVCIWDAIAWVPKKTFPCGADRVAAVAASPDGRQVATFNINGDLRLWDMADRP